MTSTGVFSDPNPSAAAAGSSTTCLDDTAAVVTLHQSKARARGRWKLLQQALCSSNHNSSSQQPTNTTTDDASYQQYSKRRFPGYRMLESSLLEKNDSAEMTAAADWRANLERIETVTTGQHPTRRNRSVDAIRNDIECSVLALRAMLHSTTSNSQVNVPTNDSDENNNQEEKAVAVGNKNNHHGVINLWMDSDPQLLLWPEHLNNNNNNNNNNNSTRSITTADWLDMLPALRNVVGDVSLTHGGTASDERDYETHPTEANTVSERRWRLTFSILDHHHQQAQETKKNSRTPQYYVRKYQLPSRGSSNDKLFILARERQVSVHTKLSLQELVSHRQNHNNNNNNNNGSSSTITHGAVDNTGNICVWDCALTLAWALQQQQQQQLQPPNVIRTVLELGAGMAAVSALSLAVTLPSSSGTHIYITDGHADCVLNNRVNVRLMQAAGLWSTTNHPGRNRVIDCRQLLWTTEQDDAMHHAATTKAESKIVADLTLIADCTHFQEYHAALFWTAVQHTAIGGQIWMCQPDRGNSLERFLTLICVVNENNGNGGDSTRSSCNHNNNNNKSPSLSLLRVTEQHYPALDARHEEFLHQSNNDSSNNSNHYDPNLHRPRILVLTKERAATEQDRQCALQHMRERDLRNT